MEEQNTGAYKTTPNYFNMEEQQNIPLYEQPPKEIAPIKELFLQVFHFLK